MNTENLSKLIDYLENTVKDDQFDMAEWCGTACCIAGHAVALFGGKDGRDVQTTAANLLGLKTREADILFFAWSPDEEVIHDLEYLTKDDAVKVLKHLRDTGWVDWTIVPTD